VPFLLKETKMPISQQGALNTTALVVPDTYVQIVAPQNLNLNGVPSDILGLVGTASWGPVGMPVICSDSGDYAAAFGPIINRGYDMGTHLAIASQQGAGNFRCVRVTDGTDVAASATFLASLDLTAKYTGSLGNALYLILGPGSAASTTRATIGIPGFTPEIFDNIAGTGATLWTNMANAINLGNGNQRGASNFVTAAAVAGGTTAAPTSSTTYGFAAATGVTAVVAGADGASTVTDTLMLGVDTLPRHGMYALRKQGCGLIVLCDVTSYSTFTTQAAFGLDEGAYMICAEPAGSATATGGITTAITNKQAAGVDSYALKLMFGDWVYWIDSLNQVTRLVSPQSFVAGRLANLSPEQSSLNKPIYGVVGTQKSGIPGTGQVKTYAQADLTALFQAGFDVISDPQPGGNYWGVRCGHNSSSDPSTSGDNYTRLTNYIALTLSSGMGSYVGQLINNKFFLRVRATLNGFLAGLVQQGLLSPLADGTNPYKVVCDSTNNPDSRTALGYSQADVQVKYQAINEKFIINVEGGVSVQLASSTT
jgi:hypothetical protein